MREFLITKRFELGFLGEAWKTADAHINFKSFTAGDVKDMLPELAVGDGVDAANTQKTIDTMLKILGEKFVSGVGVDSDSKTVDLDREDLLALPLEVIGKAISFLSQGLEGPKEQL